MAITINGTTGIAGVDGSAGTPALQGADTNTGMFFPAADTIAFTTAGTEDMRIDSSGNVGIGTTSPQRKLDVTVNDTTTAQLFLRNNNASYASGIIVYNAGGEASIFRHNGGSDTSYGGANSLNVGTITNNNFAFITNNTERMRIDSSGNLLVGTTSVSGGRVNVLAAAGATGIVVQVSTNGNYGLAFSNASGTNVGRIQIDSAATQFVTSSDYRLKNSISPMTGALAKVALLKPCTYKWNEDNSDAEGFIAHELAEVCPQAVSGEKDAVDANGNIISQGIDTSFLVATLTAAIQELQAIITALTARITALEGASA